MCGIFGWSIHPGAKLTQRQRESLAAVLGILSDQRGGHAWGWYAVDVDEIRHGLEQMGIAATEAAASNLFMGHTRFATHGLHTLSNAHPFEQGSIVGAHNGVIFNHTILNVTHGRSFEVDSQHIFAHLDEGRSLSELEGYGAIEWVRRPALDRIYLCRLERGDLHVWRAEGIVAWASDDNYLKQAFKTAKLVKLSQYEIIEGEELFAQDGKLYTTKAEHFFNDWYYDGNRDVPPWHDPWDRYSKLTG